jgi:hypothetical protein
MKHVVAACRALVVSFVTLLLLCVATAPCGMAAGALPLWVRYGVFGFFCLIAVVLGFASYQTTLDRWEEKRGRLPLEK